MYWKSQSIICDCTKNINAPFSFFCFIYYMMRPWLFYTRNQYVPISIPGPCMLTLVFLHVLLRLATIKYWQTGKLNQPVKSAELITPQDVLCHTREIEVSFTKKHEEMVLGGREKNLTCEIWAWNMCKRDSIQRSTQYSTEGIIQHFRSPKRGTCPPKPDSLQLFAGNSISFTNSLGVVLSMCTGTVDCPMLWYKSKPGVSQGCGLMC